MSSRQLLSEHDLFRKPVPTPHQVRDKLFRDHAVKLAAAAAAWLMATALAAAEPVTSADTPTGDVWVTPGAARPLPPQAAQNTPIRRPLPTGDFWPTDDGATRTADAPAPPKDAVAREESGAGGAK
jgi:hypothetical protein